MDCTFVLDIMEIRINWILLFEMLKANSREEEGVST